MTGTPHHHDGSAARAADVRKAHRIALAALLGGLPIMGAKLGVFALTNSAAVLSDALESTVNVLAAGVAMLTTWYAAQPADRLHPYGHGKAEFFAVGFEGVLIIAAGAGIIVESIRRLMTGQQAHELTVGILLLAAINVVMALLAAWVWRAGVRLHSPTLIADGKHLATDVATTAGVVVGLIAVRLTGVLWLDAALAIAVAIVIFITGGRLMLESWRGLMDRLDPVDDAMIRRILDEEVASGQIVSYHKVRHRHTGGHHWVDLHLQVPGAMSVAEAHERASRIERRIEDSLGLADATAHVEPAGSSPADRAAGAGPLDGPGPAS
jgi:cation diffusion facilitator family transporter